jgi:WD40 repeat protein
MLGNISHSNGLNYRGMTATHQPDHKTRKIKREIALLTGLTLIFLLPVVLIGIKRSPKTPPRGPYTVAGPHGAEAYLAFSPDSKMLASAGRDASLHLWNTQTGALLRTLKSRNKDFLSSVTFAPDGKILVSGGYFVSLWDPATGKLLGTLNDPSTIGINRVAFSPDGRWLVSASFLGKVNLWEPRTRKLRKSMNVQWSEVASVAFARDGQLIALGSIDGKVTLWDVPRWELLAELKENGNPIRGDLSAPVAFSPDGQTLVSSSAGYRNGHWSSMVCVWDVRTGVLRRKMPISNRVAGAVAFSPDGTEVALGVGELKIAEPAEVQLWNAQMTRVTRTLTLHSGEVTSLAFSPDGKTLAASSYGMGAKQAVNEIRLWNMETSQVLHTLAGKSRSFDLGKSRR